MPSWDERFLDLAAHIATWSKDPSTQVGAVIVDPLKRVVSTGYNGFPMNTADHLQYYLEREKKLLRVVHAEANAILFAKRDLTGCTLYCTMHPCANCAALIIQSGISRVVCPPPDVERWQAHYDEAQMMMYEASVILNFKEKPDESYG